MEKQAWRSLPLYDDEPNRFTNIKKCDSHNSINLSYVAHFEWMERKEKQGYFQKQCNVCGYYFFKCEY